MNEISIGAVGAAVIAGLISLFGLIIAKEQKVSEFRQAWIDELRKCCIAYLVNINAIADFVRLSANDQRTDKSPLIPHYKALNEASHGIKLRVNGEELTAADLLSAMTSFEELARENSNLTPEKISVAENKFLMSARQLLKHEWKRVKRGEVIFVWTKRIVLMVTCAMLVLGIVITQLSGGSDVSSGSVAAPVVVVPSESSSP